MRDKSKFRGGTVTFTDLRNLPPPPEPKDEETREKMAIVDAIAKKPGATAQEWNAAVRVLGLKEYFNRTPENLLASEDDHTPDYFMTIDLLPVILEQLAIGQTPTIPPKFRAQFPYLIQDTIIDAVEAGRMNGLDISKEQQAELIAAVLPNPEKKLL